MNSVEKAFQTQLQNIQHRAGKTLEELYALIGASGLTRHGEIRDMLKRDLALGHGDANTLAQFYLQSTSPGAGVEVTPEQAIDALYAGPKAALRPIHDRLMAAIGRFGPFEVAPKKGYVSLRRKRQFAMVGPATRSRVEVGLNLKGVAATPRLVQLPPGGMCQYRVDLSDPAEVDEELVGWIRQAYESAG